MRITGKTRIMFILADAVDHILGSDVLNRAFEEMGLNVAVVPLSVKADDLADTIAMIRRFHNLAGFGVTIPHKIAVLDLLDEVTDAARDIGAVNFVRRDADGKLTGHNIDGEGFLAGLKAHDFDVSGARVLQVGAGGVGRAIAFALAGSGVASIDLINRNQAKGNDLATAILKRYPDMKVAVHTSEADAPQTSFDLVINATSLGMHSGDALPLSSPRLHQSCTVAEVIMSPAMTPILAEAGKIGCQTVPGMAMMQPQPSLVARFLGLSA